MTWYPARVLPSLAILAGLTLACAGGSGANPREPAPRAAPPPPAGSTVSSDEDARWQPNSIDQMLAGRIAGVTVTGAPGGGIVVRMGGPTSFYSNQDPLYVVDGVPVVVNRGTLTWINPRDIESITALKDPSQTAIYGVRGSNGVIIIKTKGSH
jgi:TonB-dependent SusC/RagA subfamily outer membrane receptor